MAGKRLPGEGGGAREGKRRGRRRRGADKTRTGWVFPARAEPANSPSPAPGVMPGSTTARPLLCSVNGSGNGIFTCYLSYFLLCLHYRTTTHSLISTCMNILDLSTTNPRYVASDGVWGTAAGLFIGAGFLGGDDQLASALHVLYSILPS